TRGADGGRYEAVPVQANRSRCREVPLSRIRRVFPLAHSQRQYPLERSRSPWRRVPTRVSLGILPLLRLAREYSGVLLLYACAPSSQGLRRGSWRGRAL